MHAIVEDKKLGEACESAGMSCYKNLAQFITTDEVKGLLQGKISNDVLGSLEKQIDEFLNQNIEFLIDEVENELFSDSIGMVGGDGIPGEMGEIFLTGINRPHDLKLEGETEYYGGSLFVVDFYVRVELQYEYPVFKSEAFDLDPKKYSMQYLNEHYFEVETTDEFGVRGRFELEYDIDLNAIGSVDNLLSSLSQPAVTVVEFDKFELLA